MQISVRAADVDSDRKPLIEVLSRNLPRVTDGSAFDRLYRKNPCGSARVWVATENGGGVVVGASAAFPRRMYVNGRDTLGWVLGDFCIDGPYRSLGPALMLQRACLADVDSGAAAFCYDFPSQTMMAVYKRLQIEPFGYMVRLAKPLRVDRRVGESVKNPALAGGLSRIGNLFLRLGEKRSKDDCTLNLSVHRGDCGEEFSALDKKLSGRHGVSTQRSAEYLNWRYVSHSSVRYELLTARRDNQLSAYVVFNQDREQAMIADLFGIEDPALIKNLGRALIRILRERGVVTVAAWMIDSHPWIPLLVELGFKARESLPVVVYGSSEIDALTGTKWFIMDGDRDG
jgi:hypothetical protein